MTVNSVKLCYFRPCTANSAHRSQFIGVSLIESLKLENLLRILVTAVNYWLFFQFSILRSFGWTRFNRLHFFSVWVFDYRGQYFDLLMIFVQGVCCNLQIWRVFSFMDLRFHSCKVHGAPQVTARRASGRVFESQ